MDGEMELDEQAGKAAAGGVMKAVRDAGGMTAAGIAALREERGLSKKSATNYRWAAEQAGLLVGA